MTDAKVPRTRREALRAMGTGFGMTALAAMLGESMRAAETGDPWEPKEPHFAPRAKRVIFVFLSGGLSAIDSFDHKPALDRYDGKPLPYATPRTEFTTGNLMRSPFAFAKYGRNGHEVSEIFPHIGESIDEFCQIRSMITDIPNHGPSVMMMNTGNTRFARPSMGSWVTYGLGTENRNLPGFIVLSPSPAGDGGVSRWGSAFLPSIYQGTFIPTSQADPKKQIQYLANPKFSLDQQRRQVDLLERLNHMDVEEQGKAPELEAAIQSMEVAFRMQTEAPDVFDISKESQATRELYGAGEFARGCLMARRLVERGVRMVQIYHGTWDHHADILGHKFTAAQVDGPIAGLVQDLKQRGLLDSTLVIVGSEFGRTPVLNLGGFRSVHNGRDHNIYGFTVLLAGGGVQAGLAYGATDEFGFKVAENPVHVHDLHATILYLLGLDHTRLTYRYSGRDFRLTDVAGRVVKDIIAGEKA
jgi:Protein of unknown function (DUF1501)